VALEHEHAEGALSARDLSCALHTRGLAGGAVTPPLLLQSEARPAF
jgi:hypothetical protein